MTAWVAAKQNHRVAVVAGVRTPFAKAGGALKECSAVHMGVTASREAMAKAGIAPTQIEEAVFGNAGTPADAANISRVIALRSGIPESASAFSVHRNCASAMEAVAQGCLKIGAGLADTMLVGGTESMSQMPLLFNEEMKAVFGQLSTAKTGADKLKIFSEFRPHMLKPIIAILQGLTDPVSGMNMGQTAEVLARDFSITREEQDKYALRSHQRAVQGRAKLAEEIQPIVLEPTFKNFVEQDQGPRESQSLEQLAKLKPFFDRETGTVTAGNACPITDGAGAMVLMSEAKAKAEGMDVLGWISGFAFAGCDPKRMGLGPVYSSSKLLTDSKTDWRDIELVELNEAFAAQVLANQKAWSSKKYCTEKLGRTDAIGELSDDKLNVNGGAIALGHPVGASGVRILLTLLMEMKRRNLHKGLATLCIGGGQGGAFLVERT